MTDFPSSPVSSTLKQFEDLKLAAEAFRRAMIESGAINHVGQDQYFDELRALERALNPLNYRGLAQRPQLHRAELIKEVSEMIAAGVADDLSSDEIADNVLLSIDLIQRGIVSDTSTDRPMERPKVYDSQGREVYRSAPTSTDGSSK